MNTIEITAPQIKEVLMETDLVERKFHEQFYESFGYLEGKPVVEEIGDEKYRLFTVHENYKFYKQHRPNVTFECVLK